MYKVGRLLSALAVLLSGTIVTLRVAIPSDEVTWETYAGARIYGPTADLSVTISDSSDPVAVGESLTYTVFIVNGGPSDVTGVMLRNDLPPGVTLESTVASQGSCSGVEPVICDLGALDDGRGATVSITVTPLVSGLIYNSATVWSDGTDPDTSNNTATASTTVRHQVFLPLALRK